MKSRDEIDAFHKHFDACTGCYEKPYTLCATGAYLLQISINEITDSPVSPSVPKKGA